MKPASHADTTPARPGFLAGFVASFSRGLREALPPKKALILLAVLALPVVLTLPVRDSSQSERGEILLVFVCYLYLNFLVPVTAFLFGSAVLLEEQGAGTLPYLFTRPAPRISIILGKYCAGILLGGVLLTASILAAFRLFGATGFEADLTRRTLTSILCSFPAYVAAYTLLSIFTRWALLGGLLYSFGLEGAINLIPGMVKNVTLLYYSRSLVADAEGASRPLREILNLGRDDVFATVRGSLAVLLFVTAISLLLTWWIIGRREFVQRNAGRA